MDELDDRIIKVLQNGGRSPNSVIARGLGVSEGTMRRRLKHLIAAKSIRVVALPNPKKFGLESEDLIGIQADPNTVDQVVGSLSELDEIKCVVITTGSYDIFAWSNLPSTEALGIVLSTKLRITPRIRHTETFVSLERSK